MAFTVDCLHLGLFHSFVVCVGAVEWLFCLFIPFVCLFSHLSEDCDIWL